MGDLQKSFEALRHDEMQRDNFAANLVHRLIALELEGSVLGHDFRQGPIFCDEHMENISQDALVITDLQLQITNLLGRMVSEYPTPPQQEHGDVDSSTPFVVVLVNGNGSPLIDQGVQEGYEGGRRVARKFHDHLVQYLMDKEVFEKDWKLILKFYASMNNLGTFYIKSGIINNIGIWRRFIYGFNDAYQYAAFIDSGDDALTCDERIRSQIDIYFGHDHCQHTILVTSSEGSYTGFLRKHTRDDHLCGQLTIVEAIPFPGEFHELVSKFLPKRKEGLFAHTPYGLPTPPTTPEHKPIRAEIDVALTPTSPLAGTKRSLIYMPVGGQLSSDKRILTLSKCPMSPIMKALPPSQIPLSPPLTPPETPGNDKGRQHWQEPLPKRPQLSRRKPRATVQPTAVTPKVPRSRNTFFDAQGRRIDLRTYIQMYSQRYLHV